jgi:hypothetical protein
MPAVSEKQRRLMLAAKHGATFPKAVQLRKAMTLRQLSEYAKQAPR